MKAARDIIRETLSSDQFDSLATSGLLFTVEELMRKYGEEAVDECLFQVEVNVYENWEVTEEEKDEMVQYRSDGYGNYIGINKNSILNIKKKLL